MEGLKKTNLQLVLVGIIIIVAVLYAIFVKPYYFNFNGGEIFFEPIYVESISDNMTYDIYAYDQEIYISSVNGFKKVARNGEHLWDQSFYARNASLFHAGEYMCVVDVNGTDAYLFDTQGLIVEISTDYPIITADLNAGGAMSFMMETGSSYRIDIYNRLGEKAATREVIVDEAGYPISMDLSDNGEILAISHIKIDDTGTHTNLTFLGFNDTTKKDPNHIVGAQILNDVWMAEVVFYDDQHLVGISKDQLYFYNCEDGVDLIATYPFTNELIDYEMTEKAMVLVFYDPILMNHEIVVLDHEAKELSRDVIEGSYANIASDDQNYYIIESYIIEKYEESNRIWFTETSRTVSNIISLGKEYYLLEYGSSFEIIKMKEM